MNKSTLLALALAAGLSAKAQEVTYALPNTVFTVKVTVQQIGVGYGGLFERQDDVCSTAYWYQCEPHTAFPKLPGVKERWPR